MSSRSLSIKPGRTAASRALALALFALVVLVVAGCGGGSSTAESPGGSGGGGGGGGGETAGEPRAGGTLQLSQGEEIITMNPLKAYVPEDINVINQIFEPLFKENTQEKIVPWLVEKYAATDNDKTWTMQLKPGIKFSTGKPMTSADVRWSLERDMESEIYATIVEGFEKVEAPSPTTVVVKTKEPRPEMPNILSQWTFSVLPKGFGGVSEKQFSLHPVGTGPFKFVSWKKGESITLEKNPYYWQKGLPYLETVVFHTVPNAQSRVSQLRGGQLSLIFSPPFQEIESLEGGETEVGEYAEGYSWIIVLNVRKPLFENKKVREAVNLGVDRGAMIEAALRGHGTEAGAYLAPSIKGWDSSIKPVEQNVAKAKELLAEAVKEGADPTFTLMTPAELPFWTNAIQIAQQNLDEIGFKVSIKKIDNSSAVSLADEGEFDAFAVFNTQQVQTPVELFSFYNGVEANWSGADTTEMEKLLSEAQAEVNPQKRQADWGHMQQVIADEQNIILLVYSPFIWAFQKDVTGFFTGATGTAWLGETALTE